MQGVFMMTVKILLTLLLLLLTLLTGARPLRLTEIHVMSGELVTLQCPRCRGCNHEDAKLIWTSHTTQEMNLTDSLSSAEQRQMGVLVHGRSLVIFNSSVNHQGNYSCTWRNTSRQSWFRLTVCTNQTREYEESTTYSKTCSEPESCRLNCPAVNVPAENIPNITSQGITWHKEGDLLPEAGYFSSVKESDHGVYTCTRSYLYHGQIYNRTFTLEFDVTPKKKSEKSPVISSPRMGDVFYVDLGSTVVIDCKADMYSDFDEVFWLSGTSFVKKNNSLPVFYNYTSEHNTEGIKTTASLVFKKVSEEDLSKNYTCKLESSSKPSSFVTITMAQKDGKRNDASFIDNKTDTDAGLNEDDRKGLKSVLEERFGYSLCVCDPNTLPGKAFVEAVLDCIKQSRTVVLVPAPLNPWPGSDLLNDIHAAFVRWQTRLVVVKIEATEVSRSGSLPEVLQLLGKAGDHVIRKVTHSRLHYYLPALQRAPK